jgi:hypothetical protein
LHSDFTNATYIPLESHGHSVHTNVDTNDVITVTRVMGLLTQAKMVRCGMQTAERRIERLHPPAAVDRSAGHTRLMRAHTASNSQSSRGRGNS